MLPILHRVRLNASPSTRGAIPFRSYTKAQKPRQAKLPHLSTRTSGNRTSTVASKLIKFFLVIGVIRLGLEEWAMDDSPYGIKGIYKTATLRYHGLNQNEMLFRPLYLPIQEANEIRLLVLEPGEASDDIRCRLKHVLLSDNPKYEALSYVWGDSTKECYITCDDKQVKIGKELFKALHSLRKSECERTIWVDALCINQSDNDEKARQVAIMGHIYASSQNVTVWLGQVNSQTAGAFKALRAVDSWLKGNGRGNHEGYFNREVFLEMVQKQFTPEELGQLRQYDLGSIYALLESPWFYRVWTLQELQMAPTAMMVHGGQSMSAWDFFAPLTFLTYGAQADQLAASYNIPQDSFKAFQVLYGDGISSLLKQQYGTLLNFPLLRLVAEHNSTRGATDPRDRIYAFRSMSDHDSYSDPELFPDYQASVEEVYSRFARWCLHKNKQLKYLGFAGLPDSSKSGPPIGSLPSWVADWTPNKRVGLPDSLRWADKAFQAGSALKPTTLWEPSHPRLLHIKGRVVDVLAERAVARADLLSYHNLTIVLGNSIWFKPKMHQVLFELKMHQVLFKILFLSSHQHPYSQLDENDVKGLLEAQQTMSKYSSVKGPRHMLVDVVWMERCKEIAKLGTSTDRFDVFWQAMTRQQETHTSHGFIRTIDDYFRFDDFWRMMTVTGDKVNHLGYGPRDLKMRFDMYLHIRAFNQIVNRYQGTSLGYTTHEIKKAFGQYLRFLNRVRDGKHWPSPLPGSLTDRIEAQDRLSRSRKPFIQPSFQLSAAAVDKSEMTMRKLMWDFWGGILVKRFGATSEGRLGWFPRRAERGDLICIFDGAAMPYVIRPRKKKWSEKVSFTYWDCQLSGSLSPLVEVNSDPELGYVVVGECYVHGLMNGEALAHDDRESKFITLS